ncbi:MAG: 50S ribosomal protein L4 [Thermoanaerobaculia bacterium]
MKIAVKNFDSKQVKELDLPAEIFSYPYKEHLVHLVVLAYLAGLRSGTHKTKTRSEVAGAGKKLWKQKGTGRARVGSIRSPLWRKGGTVHGPVPRDYSQDLSTGEKKNALKSVLSRKLKEDRIIVLDSLAIPSHKTQALEAILAKVGAEGKILLVDTRDNRNLDLAARNHPGWKTVDALAVNVYDVVDRPYLVVSEQALARLVEVLGA